eukprot:4043588-Prymnesium_polylepis.2
MLRGRLGRGSVRCGCAAVQAAAIDVGILYVERQLVHLRRPPGRGSKGNQGRHTRCFRAARAPAARRLAEDEAACTHA